MALKAGALESVCVGIPALSYVSLNSLLICFSFLISKKGELIVLTTRLL